VEEDSVERSFPLLPGYIRQRRREGLDNEQIVQRALEDIRRWGWLPANTHRRLAALVLVEKLIRQATEDVL
jgi:hypothetical protein